jgi:hypothetical protein
MSTPRLLLQFPPKVPKLDFSKIAEDKRHPDSPHPEARNKPVKKPTKELPPIAESKKEHTKPKFKP